MNSATGWAMKTTEERLALLLRVGVALAAYGFPPRGSGPAGPVATTLKKCGIPPRLQP